MREFRLDWFGEHMDVESGVGEAASTEVSREEGMEDESMCEDEEENDGEDVDDKDTDKESESSSSSTHKALALPAATLTGATTFIAGLSRASWETGRMVSLDDSL